MKIVASTALILSIATSAFAMTPVADINLHAGSDSDQRMAAVAQTVDHNSGAAPVSEAFNGSDSDQRIFLNAETSKGAGTLFLDLTSGDDNEQRRAAR